MRPYDVDGGSRQDLRPVQSNKFVIQLLSWELRLPDLDPLRPKKPKLSPRMVIWRFTEHKQTPFFRRRTSRFFIYLEPFPMLGATWTLVKFTAVSKLSMDKLLSALVVLDAPFIDDVQCESTLVFNSALTVQCIYRSPDFQKPGVALLRGEDIYVSVLVFGCKPAGEDFAYFHVKLKRRCSGVVEIKFLGLLRAFSILYI